MTNHTYVFKISIYHTLVRILLLFFVFEQSQLVVYVCVKTLLLVWRRLKLNSLDSSSHIFWNRYLNLVVIITSLASSCVTTISNRVVFKLHLIITMFPHSNSTILIVSYLGRINFLLIRFIIKLLKLFVLQNNVGPCVSSYKNKMKLHHKVAKR